MPTLTKKEFLKGFEYYLDKINKDTYWRIVKDDVAKIHLLNKKQWPFEIWLGNMGSASRHELTPDEMDDIDIIEEKYRKIFDYFEAQYNDAELINNLINIINPDSLKCGEHKRYAIINNNEIIECSAIDYENKKVRKTNSKEWFEYRQELQYINEVDLFNTPVYEGDIIVGTYLDWSYGFTNTGIYLVKSSKVIERIHEWRESDELFSKGMNTASLEKITINKVVGSKYKYHELLDIGKVLSMLVCDFGGNCGYGHWNGRNEICYAPEIERTKCIHYAGEDLEGAMLKWVTEVLDYHKMKKSIKTVE